MPRQPSDDDVDGEATPLRAGDLRVLEILRDHGDDLSKPRHTLLFFYRRKEDARPGAEIFDRIEQAAKSSGLGIAHRDDRALILEGHLRLNPEAIEPLIEWSLGWAEATGAEFDGWECQVLPAE